MKNNNNVMAVLTHILGLVSGFLGPLIVLLVSENNDVKKQARFALNWQISLIIYTIVGLVLTVILIGFLVIVAVGILNFVFSIMAAIKTSEGKTYAYPLSIPFLSVS